MRKPDFCICENKLISVFVFATRILQFLYFLNPKFQASSHLLWLYSPVCVGPGQKPRRPVFSQRGSNYHEMSKPEWHFTIYTIGQGSLVSSKAIHTYLLQADPNLTPTSGTFFREYLVMKILPFLLIQEE